MLYTKLFFTLFAFSLMSCSSAEKSDQTSSSQENNVQEEQPSKINFEKAVFIDVRTPEEYDSGTYKDAKNIPLNTLEGRLNELDKEDQIVVFCRSGGRASQAASILEKAGFTNVVNGINVTNLSELENN